MIAKAGEERSLETCLRLLRRRGALRQLVSGLSSVIVVALAVGLVPSTVSAAEYSFVYIGGTAEALKGRQVFCGLNSSVDTPCDVNASGQITGRGANGRAYRQTGAVVEDLGVVPGGISSGGLVINDAGDVAGWSYVLPEGVVHTFLYSDGVMHDLGNLSGYTASPQLGAPLAATAINASRQIVGSISRGVGFAGKAFLYTDGVLQNLGTLFPPLGDSFGWGLNDLGHVVGETDVAIPGGWIREGFVYSGGFMQRLGRLGGGPSAAYSINNHGEIVGVSSTAVLWRDGVLMDLNTLIPANSGVTLSSATWINDAGQIYSGEYRLDPVVSPNVVLVTRKGGSGSGTVTSDSPINCEEDCPATSTALAPGATVTLNATPTAGHTFEGWSGGGCTGTGSCVVTVTVDTVVTATFAPPPPPPPPTLPPTLSIGKIGLGTGTVQSTQSGINCGSTCFGSFPIGTMLTLTATAAPGSFFVEWSGGGCTNSGPCTVTLNADTAVTARFALGAFSINLTKAGGGVGTVTSYPAGIACNASCPSASSLFGADTQVTLTAVAASGSAFGGWNGGGCAGTGSCVVTLTAGTAMTATFGTLDSPRLTVNKAGTSVGTVTSSPAGISCGPSCPSASLVSLQPVTLTALAAVDAVFVAWSGGGCSGTGVCTVPMTADTTVTAIFNHASALTVIKTGSGAGTVSSTPLGLNCGPTCTSATLMVEDGTVVRLTATPATGSVFTGWIGGGCEPMGLFPCSVPVPAATQVTAGFAPAALMTVSLRGTVEITFGLVRAPGRIACPSTCTTLVSLGATITLTATPGNSETFVGWSGACTGSAATCTVVMNGDRSVTATFVGRLPPRFPETFTDDPALEGITVVKAVHVTELRMAINAVRVARGLAQFFWSDPVLSPRVTEISITHLMEMRTALTEVHQFVNGVAPVYVDDPLVSEETVIKAVHVNQLRDLARGLR